MESAFGVEHGDISKGVTWANAGRRVGGVIGRISGHGKRAANKEISITGIGDSTGKATQNAGRGLTSAGDAMRRNSTATGYAVVGAGGTAGVLTYKHGKKAGAKKARKQPEAM